VGRAAPGRGQAVPHALGRNLEKAGRPRPAGHAAHHIVPHGESRFPEAKKIRKILKKFNMDIYDAENGVGHVPWAAFGRKYYKEICTRSGKAKKRREVINTLSRIDREPGKKLFFR
jgi:hypothetical protein